MAGMIAGAVLAAAGCGAGEGGSGEGGGEGHLARSQRERAEQVAAAWDGSAAADAWRAGYHPLGEVTRLPRGGLRTEADREAYREHQLVVEGELPPAPNAEGRVRWPDGASVTRPMTGAEEAHRALAVARQEGRPHLTVTGVRLGEMTVATGRGPATVPAWLFTLKGYDTPLKRAAVQASELPAPPVRTTTEQPGLPLEGLVEAAHDRRTVVVAALRGKCDEEAGVEVLETRGSVVVWAPVVLAEDAAGKGAAAMGDAGLCTSEARVKEETVTLDAPLGTRLLLDAHTGRPLPFRPLTGPPTSWS